MKTMLLLPLALLAACKPAPVKEKTEFDVVLTEIGTNKVAVIMAVREVTPGLGLADVKKLVENTPTKILEGVGKNAAEHAKQKIEEAGAKIELK